MMCWHVEVFHPVDQSINAARYCTTKRGAGSTEDVSYRFNERHWHLSLGRVVCGFPRLPSGWVQSKSGDLYLALQMALWIISCGSPISSSVRFVA